MKKQNRNRNVRRAVLEALESRQMLSTVSLADGVLTLAGDANAGTALTVTLQSGGTNLVAQAGDAKQTYALNQVKRIQAFGGTGNDTIAIDQALALPTWISAGEGNNTVLGGGGDDTIFAGRGNDQINGRGGNNLIMDLDAQGNPVVTSSGDIDAPAIGPVEDPGTTTDRDLPQVKNLNITWSGRNVTVTADAQEGVTYLVQVQGNETAPRVFACQGSLPVTFSLPIADRVFGVIVTPISNGIAGAEASKVLDVGSVGKVQAPNPVFGGISPSNGGSGSTPTTPTTPADPQTPPPTQPTQPVDNGGDSPASTQVEAKFTMVGQVGYAGSAVQVDGTSSTLGKYDPLTVRYHWDFGDVDSAGNEAKYNQLDGFNAAHAYDRAGTYTVTLTLTDPTGAVSVSHQTVNILADTRRTIYVASDGSDANTGLSQNAAVRSMARVQQLMGDNTRVLFKSGQTFNMDQSLSVSFENVYLGAYGSGNKPRINWSGEWGNSIRLSGHNDVVQGLSFDTPALANNPNEQGPFAIMASGVDLVVRDCEFLNVCYGINGNGKPDGILVQDNVAPLATGVKAYLVWCEGSDYTIIGNTAANSTREHIVRMEGTQRMNISYNNFTNLDRTGDGDSHDASKGTIVVHDNTYAWIAHNTINDGPIGTGPLSSPGAATDAKKAERSTWSVVEANDVYNTSIIADQGTAGAVFRNNIIHPPADNSFAFRVVGYNSEYQRGVEKLEILNNTVISDNANGGFLNLSGRAQGITMDNNLFVDHNLRPGANGTAVVFVTGSDLSSFSEIKDNMWDTPNPYSYAQGGAFYVWPSWSDSKGYLTLQEWSAYSQVSGDQVQVLTLDGRNAPQGALDTVSSVPGVFTDFYGNARSIIGSTTVGAVAA